MIIAYRGKTFKNINRYHNVICFRGKKLPFTFSNLAIHFRNYPGTATATTADGDNESKTLYDLKMEGKDGNNQIADEAQNPLPLLELIAGSLNNDRPIKLDTFHKLSASLKQHFKMKMEHGASNQNKIMSDDTVSNLMTIVHNVIGANTENLEMDQNSSHQSSLSNKDPETVILSGKCDSENNLNLI